MVKCTRCGARFEGKVNFCTVCGAPVRKETGSKIKYVLIIAGLLIAVGIITVAIFKAGIFNKDDMSEASLENEVQTEVGDEDEGSTYQSNDKDEYIIPDSDREYIQSSDLTKLTVLLRETRYMPDVAGFSKMLKSENILCLRAGIQGQ